MRPTTLACARFESKGKPEKTVTLLDKPTKEILLELAHWTLATEMGHYIRITIARSPEELEKACRERVAKPAAVAAEELAADIAAMIADLPDDIIGD